MTPIEIIALVVIVIGILKILILLIDPLYAMTLSLKILRHRKLSQIFSLIFGGVVLYYLLKEGIGIIYILAVAGFLFCLIYLGLVAHLPDIVVEYKSRIKRGKLWQESWLYVLIWLFLIGWGIYALFF